MEDSNTALLEAKNTSHKTHDQEILSSSHSHHMYEKFIRCFPKKKKRRSWEFLSPILQTEFFLTPPPKKKIKSPNRQEKNKIWWKQISIYIFNKILSQRSFMECWIKLNVSVLWASIHELHQFHHTWTFFLVNRTLVHNSHTVQRLSQTKPSQWIINLWKTAFNWK